MVRCEKKGAPISCIRELGVASLVTLGNWGQYVEYISSPCKS